MLFRGLLRASGVVAALAVLTAVFSVNLPTPACALTFGQAIGTGFPRLGSIWPNPRVQPLEDIARFDHVALQPYDRAFIPQLRALNPDIIVLTSANAAELQLDSSSVPAAGANDAISKVPNKWIQTQLGSTLAATATAESTTLRVYDTSRFRVDDILIIENELAKVVGIGDYRLTVVRGLIPTRSPAAVHAKKTRVAAVVVFWPGSVVMDLSDYCPHVPIDATVGPETWAEYNARMGIDRVNAADWDGIFIDRTNSNAYINNLYTRSIDPKRTNVPVTDGYATLNASWNSGLRKYEALIRAGAPGKVILANNGHAYHDLLNGTVLESFPKRGLGFGPLDWTDRMFGTNGRSFANLSRCYATYVASSLQPNLTTIETYEDDRAPTRGTRPDDPSLEPSWTPDYPKMRFGLCSSLLSNGFFSYEIGTYQHAALNLLWFDEYDNAGQGQGYLGRPLSSARLISAPLNSHDVLHSDGSFGTLTRLGRWYVYTRKGFSLTKTLSSGTARLSVTRSKSSVGAGATLSHYGVPVTKGVTYTLSFRARGNVPLSITAGVSRPTSPWTQYLKFGTFQIGTAWKTYSIPVAATGSSSAAMLSFLMGEKTCTIWLDDVKLQGGRQLNTYRRDFQNGIALVNPDRTPVTVALGDWYRRLKGTQDPVTNNGAYVASVKLPAQDGLILLRPTPLSISSDRTIGYGATTAVAGWLKTVGGYPLADRGVTLYVSSDKSTWTKAAVTTTTVSGGYSFTVRPSSRRYYRTRFWGDADNLQGFSRVTAVSVRVYLTAPVAPSTMSHSKDYTIYGYLKPKHSTGTYPVRVYKWRYVSGKWKSYGYTNAKAYNFSTSVYTKYARSIRLPYTGKWRVRAYAPADSAHAATWSSGYDYVTVK